VGSATAAAVTTILGLLVKKTMLLIFNPKIFNPGEEREQKTV